MGKHKLLALRVLSVILPILLLSDYVHANIDNQHYMPPLECYDPYGRPQVRDTHQYSIRIVLYSLPFRSSTSPPENYSCSDRDHLQWMRLLGSRTKNKFLSVVLPWPHNQNLGRPYYELQRLRLFPIVAYAVVCHPVTLDEDHFSFSGFWCGISSVVW